MRIDNFLVKLDKICDYIPFVSTISNLVDLFQKHVVHPFRNDWDIKSHDYTAHIHDKETSRSAVLLVPVLGNIVVALEDLQKDPLKPKSYSQIRADLGRIPPEGPPIAFDLKEFQIKNRETADRVIKDVLNNKIDEAIKRANTIEDNQDRSLLFYRMASAPAALNYNLQRSFELIHRLFEKHIEQRSESLNFLVQKLIQKNHIEEAIDLFLTIPEKTLQIDSINRTASQLVLKDFIEEAMTLVSRQLSGQEKSNTLTSLVRLLINHPYSEKDDRFYSALEVVMEIPILERDEALDHIFTGLIAEKSFEEAKAFVEGIRDDFVGKNYLSYKIERALWENNQINDNYLATTIRTNIEFKYYDDALIAAQKISDPARRQLLLKEIEDAKEPPGFLARMISLFFIEQ